MEKIGASELIINNDGSIFHLHIKPQELADTVILVGDTGRVEMVSSFFESKEFRRESREFVTVTGRYNGKRITVLSTGIGTDNLDIVVNELDALVNIDFNTRTVKENKKSLRL
ncbi:MAG: phosphorylase, partial [Bacteroidales bacterium]